MTTEELQQKFLNKRVRAKKATNAKQDVVGILTFIGENEILGWKYACTIDRMPLKLESFDQLELEPQRENIFIKKK